MGRAGAIAAATSLAALLAGCSLFAPATFAPEQSVAGETDAPVATVTATAAPSDRPTSAPTATAPPSQAPLAEWRRLTKALSAPAAWLDFGFAANGDLIAIGTDDAAAETLRLFVVRSTPTGRKRSEHHLSRSVTPIPGDWAAIDPSDDSVLIDDYSLPTGLFTLRSFSTASGANIANVPSDSGINRVAIDAAGRVYGLPQYGVDGNAYAAVVRLDARGRVRSGVDYWLRALDAGARPSEAGTLAYPVAIGVGLDGRVLLVDVPDFDATYSDGTPREAAVVTSLLPSLGGPRQWELPVEWSFDSRAFGTWSHALSIAGAADGTVYVGEPVLDEAGVTITGWRVRAFDATGRNIGAWGSGVADGGITGASHPAIDAEGRLWVIETDPATGSSAIAILSLPA